jgi:hypothetical protein
MRSQALLYALAIALIAPPLFAQRATEKHLGHEVLARQVIVKLKSPSDAGVSGIRQLGDADALRPLGGSGGVYVLHSRTAGVAALIALLKTYPEVEYVEPDYILTASSVPNDPSFASQWGLLNQGTPGADIGASSAWNVSTGSKANVVGIVDSGIDYNHPDLSANIWSAPSQFTVNLSWGQLTCPAGSHGYNGITHSCDPMDDYRHGTRMAGNIGAVGNNSTGIAGVNWTANMMALKFLNSNGSGSTSDAVDAIEFALQAKSIFGTAANVRVFSNSWGGGAWSNALYTEIAKAATADALFVVAAGNDSSSEDTSPDYPAAYNASNQITVAATTENDSLAWFSNYGKNSVHLGAPGADILSTQPGASYAYASGTSESTPYVSGAALLVLSKCALTTAALKSLLLSSVDPVASLAGITSTGGRLNVYKALHSCAAPTPPSVVSVSPASGSGATQTFTFTFSDAGGASAIQSSQILFNSAASFAGGCYLFYSRASNALYLTNDAASVWQGPVTLGQNATLQNSQCSINAANSSSSVSGTNLTVNLALTFSGAFLGAKTIYAEVYDGSADSGWQQRGTWTAPSSGGPSTVSATPASGSGTTQTFAFAFSDPNGYQAITSVQILVNGAMTPSGGCYLFYYRPANALYLTNDAGASWQTPVTLGQSGSLQNSQCSVSSLTSSVTGSGTNLTVNLALTFKAAFSGSKFTYLEAFDGTLDSGWQQRGAWTVPSAGPPALVSLSPSSGSGTSQSFTLVFSDPNGYAAIYSTQILVSAAGGFTGSCYLFYYRATNSVYLTNDAATAWQTPVTLGQSGTLQNSQCSMNPATSSTSGSGNNLTLTLALTFPAAFAGAKSVYTEVYDGPGDSGWHQAGTWTVPTAGLPATVSSSPASGAGSAQTFALTFSDPNGYAAIKSTQILIGGSMSFGNACYLYYNRQANSLYLTNDAGTAWQSPVTLGQAGTLQNSQCSINPLSSSVAGSGNNLTLNLAVTFKPTFAGSKSTYMEVYDGAGDSGWQQKGTWTAQ